MKQPNCPLNPSLGVTLDPISESEQNQLTVDKPQRGGGGGKGEEGVKRKKKEGKRESVQHMEGSRGNKTGEDG